MSAQNASHAEANLTRAASLLDSIATAQASRVPPEVVVPCLLAATYLELAGGTATRTELINGEVGPTILAALTALSHLDKDVIGSHHVLAAGRAARRALNLLG